MQWHAVKVVEDGGSGSQELVIENLENLLDTSSLIVTRDGNKFKIGISQQGTSSPAGNNKIDTAAADVATPDEQSRAAASRSVLERISTQYTQQ